MAKDRCPEPLDLPTGIDGMLALAGYNYMVEQLARPIGETGQGRLNEVDAITQGMRKRYVIADDIAAGIVFLAVRDVTEIQDPPLEELEKYSGNWHS